MSRACPEYRRASNGSAFVQSVKIKNASNRIYLGRYGSPESHAKYQEFLKRWLAGGDLLPTEVVSKNPLIGEAVEAYMGFAEKYYQRGDIMSPEYELMHYSLDPLLELFAHEPISRFGPRCLVIVRTHLVQKGLARQTINRVLPRLKRFFRWCSEQELAPPELYHKLLCVKGLAKGQDGVREAEPVLPADPASIFGVLPYLSPVVAAMVEIQYRCGLRPSETCEMRAVDIDMGDRVWLYYPHRHKNDWRGLAAVKAIPPTAQRLLQPFLSNVPYCFPPAKIRMPAVNPKRSYYPSEIRRQAALKAKRARRMRRLRVNEKYSADSYRRAVDYGFRRAAASGVELQRFHPNQLRHSILTYISEKIGYQAAQRWAGHEDMNTTNLYVEKQVSELIAVADQLEHSWRSCG